MLFGIMSAVSDKAGATHSFQQKFWQVLPMPASSSSQQSKSEWSSPSRRLSPIQLSISNLGASKHARSYESLTSSSALPAVKIVASKQLLNGEASSPFVSYV